MNKILFTVASTCMTCMLWADVSVGNVIVRQQWPWSAKVNIDYVLSDPTGGEHDLKVELKNGTTVITPKAGSLSGVKLYAPNGTYLSCDPGDDLEDLGNSWGNDITLETVNPDYPEVPNTGATFELHAVGDTRVIDEDDFGGIAKETCLGKFWWGPDARGEVIGNRE